MEHYDVIIIGAGVAGLAAARNLYDYGITDVCILEAQDYIGGRVKTSYDWGQPIELGAEFVHGNQTHTARLAHELNLTTIPAYEDIILIDELGHQATHTERQDFYKLLDYVSEHGKPGVSVADFINNNPIVHSEIIKDYVKNCIRDLEGSDATELDSAAFTTMNTVWDYSGENQILIGGYKPIIDHLAKDLLIKVNIPVTLIDQTNENGALVRLVDGTELWAKRVILTCSLAVLQQKHITFIPELPTEKTSSITNLGMGNSIKYFVKFKEPFAGSMFQFSDNVSLQTISSWYASAANPNVLVGYCSGKRAAEICSLPPGRLQEKVTMDLSKIYGKSLSDQIETCLLSRWDNNPYVLGGYSNHPVGTSARTRLALAAPFKHIFWAGEATAADGGSYATVHGAIESGYRAAGEVIDSLAT